MLIEAVMTFIGHIKIVVCEDKIRAEHSDRLWNSINVLLIDSFAAAEKSDPGLGRLNIL